MLLIPLTFGFVKRESAQQGPNNHHDGKSHLGQHPLAQSSTEASQSNCCTIRIWVTFKITSFRPKPKSVWNKRGSLDGDVCVSILVIVGFKIDLVDINAGISSHSIVSGF